MEYAKQMFCQTIRETRPRAAVFPETCIVGERIIPLEVGERVREGKRECKRNCERRERGEMKEEGVK